MSNDIPRATAEYVKDVLAGYHKTTESGSKVDDGEVANARQVSEDIAKRQKKFLHDIGALSKDGYDYILTDVGEELGKYLLFNRDEEAREVFRTLLNDWNPTPEILSHFDSDGIEKEELMDLVGLATATELSTQRHEYGAEAVIDLLDWTGFLEKRDDGLYYEVNQRSTDETQPSIEADGTGPQSADNANAATLESTSENVATRRGLAPDVSNVQSGGIDISLELTGNDDPENVRQLLLAIRAGTEQNVSEYETEGN